MKILFGRLPDNAPIPPTLANVQGYGVDVFCWCNRCSHNSVVPLSVLIAQFGPDLPFRLFTVACAAKPAGRRISTPGQTGRRSGR